MEFTSVQELPTGIKAVDLDKAAKAFAIESQKRLQFTTECNANGLYQSTVSSMAHILANKPKDRFLWVGRENGKLVSYAMTHLANDVDNSLCYYMTQAWVSPTLRHSASVKEMYSALRRHASELMCRHIIVVSSRGTRGYCRFLGKNWKPYVTLLKETLF